LSNYCHSLEINFKGVYSNNRECDKVIYPSIDKLLNIVDSKYQLVHIAARRSKEMTRTEYFQIPINKYISTKNIGKALEEVGEGLITVKREEESI